MTLVDGLRELTVGSAKQELFEREHRLQELDREIAQQTLRGEAGIDEYLEASAQLAEVSAKHQTDPAEKAKDETNAQRYRLWLAGPTRGKLEFCDISTERVRRDIATTKDPLVRQEKSAQLVGWLMLSSSLK